MREAARALLVFLALGPACKSKPDTPAAPTPSASASPVASTAKPSLADASAPLTEEEKKAHALSLAAVAKGRGAVAKKDFPAAIAAFDEAVKLSPRDAQPLGERGYVKFLSGDVVGAQTDLEAARDLGSTPKVMASIWFNLGLVRERNADADGARSAFATSQEMSPTKAAAAKLVGLSTCTAEIAFAADSLQKATNWREAASMMQIDPPPSNEKDAKDAVCIFSISADGSSDQHDQCDTAPPWTVAHDHLFFFAHSHIVYPASGSTTTLLIDEVGMVGGWPAHCTGQSGGSGKIIGHYGWTTKTYDGALGVMFQPGDDTSGAVNLSDMGDVKCGDAPGSIDDTFYDLKTGAALLHVRRPIAVSAAAPLVHLDVQGSLVRVSGAGCNTTMDLTSLTGMPADAGKK